MYKPAHRFISLILICLTFAQVAQACSYCGRAAVAVGGAAFGGAAANAAGKAGSKAIGKVDDLAIKASAKLDDMAAEPKGAYSNMFFKLNYSDKHTAANK